MKNIYIILLALLSATNTGFTQLSSGAGGLTMKSGSIFSFEGLILTPGSDLMFSNNTLSRSGTAASSGSSQSINRVYSFSTPVAYSGMVQIKYIAGELNGNAESTMEIAFNPLTSGGSWVMGSGSTQCNAGTFTVSKNLNSVSLAHVSAFMYTSTLPVKLISFAANHKPGFNLLFWETAQEENMREFQVERSNNRITYEKIAVIPMIGQPSRYNYTDQVIGKGPWYYRLKMVDHDAIVSYSKITQLLGDDWMQLIKLSPNPVVNGSLNIYLSIATTIRVYNSSGVQVMQQTLTGGNNLLDVSGLSKGFYTIHNGSAVVSFIIH
jgi:Secretion system C-terminal sorting domain